jgi:type I restriction enzyme M protein
MLAPQLRQQIFSLWTAFWSSGMTNPITAIEQITYLLFLKQIEQQDAQHVKNGKRSLYSSEADPLRWSQLEMASDPYLRLTQDIFPWLRSLGATIKERWGDESTEGLEVAEYLEDAFFQLPREKTATLTLAITSVNNLFDSTGSQNSDLMGDIFEYLLDQLSTSGKNGQFRTPRHIIRFMIELLEPAEGSRIVDPAGGTAGFLTNAILYHRQRRTLKEAPEQVRLEWDGTPHRLNNSYKPVSHEFNGFDNDRTMVRIGWMNMILHGITQPRYEQRDPLSRSFPESESDYYDYAFANPPYSGNVDKGDLHPTRFPRKGTKPALEGETDQERRSREASNSSKELLTDSSELLFVWLLLDMLKPGGKMAVIVPEGLLFGSTLAHKELRKTLIYNHTVEGVISLPQGVFNPYTSVKTSILIVQKGDGKPNPKIGNVEQPRTQRIWFYEVASDGFTLGANRNPQPTKANDLWDALEKWHKRNNPSSIEADEKAGAYYQPEIFLERWRRVDAGLATHFEEVADKLNQILAVQDIFQTLRTKSPQPFQINAAEERTINESVQHLTQLIKRLLAQQSYAKKPEFQPEQLTDNQVSDLSRLLRNWIQKQDNGVLEQRDKTGSFLEQHGRAVLEQALENFRAEALPVLQAMDKAELQQLIEQESPPPAPVKNEPEGEPSPDSQTPLLSVEAKEPLPEPLELLKQFAQLDGYNIYLRSTNVTRQSEKITEPKCWIVPVRAWRENLDWIAPPKTVSKTKGKAKKEEIKEAQPEEQEPEIKGSHDDQGELRLEYINAALDSRTGFLKSDFLESECVEANDFNLSASRYKPIQLIGEVVDVGATAKLLRELLEMDKALRSELEELLDIVEGRA